MVDETSELQAAFDCLMSEGSFKNPEQVLSDGTSVKTVSGKETAVRGYFSAMSVGYTIVAQKQAGGPVKVLDGDAQDVIRAAHLVSSL